MGLGKMLLHSMFKKQPKPQKRSLWGRKKTRRSSRSLFGSGNRGRSLTPMQTIGAVALTAAAVKYIIDQDKGEPYKGETLPDGRVPVGRMYDTGKPEVSQKPQIVHKEVKMEPPVTVRRPQEEKESAPVLSEKAVELADEDYIYTQLGRLALCWYIAGADGDITSEERTEIEKLIVHVKNDPSIPEKYKKGLAGTIMDNRLTFNTAKTYLEHADPSTLIDMVREINTIALADGSGISEREKYAINAFKLFVEQKTGYHFDDLDLRAFNLDCPSCGAAMTLSRDSSKAVCSHCGFTKVMFPDM